MFLHLNHHEAIYAERRRHHEREAARWRLARVARRSPPPALPLGVLLQEAEAVLDGGLLDRDDSREAVLLEALVSQLVAVAADHDPAAAVLAPREGDPPVVAARTLGVLAQRASARFAPVSAHRAAVVRDLVRQLGAGTPRDGRRGALAAVARGHPRPATAAPARPAPSGGDVGDRSGLSA